MNLRFRRRSRALEEIEVTALIGLGDVLLVQRAIAALEARRRHFPLGAAAGGRGGPGLSPPGGRGGGIFHSARRRASSASLIFSSRRRSATSSSMTSPSRTKASGPPANDSG